MRGIKQGRYCLAGGLANRSSVRRVRPAFATAAAGNLREHSCAKVGEYRARTGDLLVANQALSQLS